MRTSILFTAAMIFLSLAAPAAAQPYSGTTGVNSAGVAAAPAAPSTLPPVFQQAAPSAVPPAVPQAPMPAPAPAPAGQVDATALPADPCAAYQASYDIYAVCQDRIKRLDRMQQLKEKRTTDAAARRQASEDRKKTATAPQDKKSRLRRPGQVAPPVKQPQQVQIIPDEATAVPK